MEIKIRLLQKGEEHLANDFFNRIYGTSRSIEDFRWEFVDGAFGGAIYVIAIPQHSDAEEKVVGIQCAIPVELVRTSGERVLTAKSEDTLVDPSFRGQKIFERMYDLLFDECRKAGIRYIWGFTPAEKAFSRLGFEIPFKTKQALMVLNPMAAYQHLSKLNPKNTRSQKFKIFGLCMAAWAKSFGVLKQGQEYSMRQGSLEELNECFFEEYAGENLYNLNITKEFAQWRFVQNPNKNNYIVLVVSKKSVDVGMVLVNVRKDVSYIEAVLVPQEHVWAAVTLAARELRRHNAGLIRVLGFDHNPVLEAQLNTMKEQGFVVLDRGSFFVWKELSPEQPIQPVELFLNRGFTQGNL